MKRIVAFIVSTLLALSLAACDERTNSTNWQEQYDLGIRYLTEGSYEEAIIAFTAAIEIDPKQALAFIGRGQAYVLSDETEEYLTAAQTDFETALALDETIPDAWLGLVDVYIRRGEYDRALEILREALDKTNGDSSIEAKLAEMERGTFSDTSGRTRRSSHFENGELVEYWLYEYDEAGNNVVTTNYQADGTWSRTETSEFDEQGREIRMTAQSEGDTSVETYEYDGLGRRIRETRTHGNGDGLNSTTYTEISYDDETRTETHDEYDSQGELSHRFVIEHDEQGVRTKGSEYRVGENGTLYLDYYVTYIWNEDGSYGGFELYQVAEKN